MAELVEEVNISFAKPFDSGGATINEVTMRRPTARDIINAREAAKSEVRAELNMIAALTGTIPEDLMEGLDGRDYVKLQSALNDFLS